MKNLTPLNELDRLAGGALQERVARAISDVSENIFDLNTQPDATRKVKVELIVKPSKSRKEAAVTIKVTAQLAPLSDLETMASIGLDSDGSLVMVEQRQDGIIDGQIDMDGATHHDSVVQFPRIAK